MKSSEREANEGLRKLITLKKSHVFQILSILFCTLPILENKRRTTTKVQRLNNTAKRIFNLTFRNILLSANIKFLQLATSQIYNYNHVTRRSKYKNILFYSFYDHFPSQLFSINKNEWIFLKLVIFNRFYHCYIYVLVFIKFFSISR